METTSELSTIHRPRSKAIGLHNDDLPGEESAEGPLGFFQSFFREHDGLRLLTGLVKSPLP